MASNADSQNNTLRTLSGLISEGTATHADVYKRQVVGTNSKRKESISPSPYKRKVVGEKGVGRFAVEKLGSKVVIETTQRGTTRKVKLELDWDKYESISSEQMKKNNRNAMFFTEVENNCWIETCSREEQGTKIKIFLSKVEQLLSLIHILHL